MQQITTCHIELDEIPQKMPWAFWRDLVLEFEESCAPAEEIFTDQPERTENNRISIYRQIKKLGLSETLGVALRDGRLYLYRKGAV